MALPWTLYWMESACVDSGGDSNGFGSEVSGRTVLHGTGDTIIYACTLKPLTPFSLALISATLGGGICFLLTPLGLEKLLCTARSYVIFPIINNL